MPYGSFSTGRAGGRRPTIRRSSRPPSTPRPRRRHGCTRPVGWGSTPPHRSASPLDGRPRIAPAQGDPEPLVGRVGVGPVVPVLDLPRSWEQARVALRFTAEGKPVLHGDAQSQLVTEVSGKGTRSPIDELTAREVDILKLIASGRSNKEIANDLSLTEGTVKGYVSNVLAKLGVQDRTQAALLAVREGLRSA